ncbi:MAG TPA: aminotransferase [Micropepsaceae bacterium]|jgi:aspartate/methionine/tyrosine aminotransferase
MTSRNLNPVFEGLGTTIFTVMSALAGAHGAINLGQGFPDEDGPTGIREAAARALRDGPNQYPPMQGLPLLRQAVAGHAKRFYDLAFDPETEVLITSGATEALTDCVMALIAPGDEAVLIEPCYDSYPPMLAAMGARVRSLRLATPDFRLTEGALAAVFSERTKLIIVNSPLNPIGRVFDRAELELLAQFLKHYDAYAVCDEVYEHLVFDGRAHVPLISLPGMRERCVRVGSAGKMFSLTGWKIGWICGPARLIQVISKAHQFNTFTTSPALQLGVAHGLEHEMDYALENTRALQVKRDSIAGTLQAVGFDVLSSEGTYFITASIRGLTNETDREFCKRITREAGITPIPLSVFYSEGGPADLVRFAFCKKRAVLEDAGKRLNNYFSALAG